MELGTVLRQLAVLFIAIGIGYIANKAKILNAEGNRTLTKVVLNIAMPCTILDSVIGKEIEVTGAEAFTFLGIASLVLLGSIAISWVVPNMMKTPRDENGLYRFMCAFGNVGFMGYPLGEAVFGARAVFFVALFNIPFTLLSYSLGIVMVSGGKGKIDFKKFLNPPLITGIVAVIIFILRIKMPTVIVSTCSMFAKVTTPGAMLVTGSTLAMLPIKEVILEKRLYVVSAVKLVILPLITYFVLRLFITNELMLGVCTLLMAAPVAANATMLSMEYGGNEKLGSKGIFVATLLSAITLPIIISTLLI